MFLLASSLLIIGVSKEAIGTCTDGLVSPGCAPGISAAYHRPSAGILALIEASVSAHTGVGISTVHIIGASRLLDTEAVLTAVERRTLTVILTLADAASAVAELVVQTVSAALTGRGADAEAAEHSTGTLLLRGAQLQLGAA